MEGLRFDLLFGLRLLAFVYDSLKVQLLFQLILNTFCMILNNLSGFNLLLEDPLT